MAQLRYPFLLMLPEIALEKIFSFLTYEEIAKNRIVCKKFNEMGGELLSRGFIRLEKRNSAIYKRVKAALPRRESERRNHPCAKHCDILQAVETRLSMLNMTYMRYIDNKLICFIPGKVLDEIKRILDIVLSDKVPARSHQLLQELRDLSSMAIEHFDEYILPKCREQMELKTGVLYKQLASVSKPRIFLQQPVPTTLTSEIRKLKMVTKSQKHRITSLIRNTLKLDTRVRKQNTKLHIQAVKLRGQERKLQEQNSKIAEQEATLTDLKKNMDDWEQKYKDLTAELVRARDEILLKTSSNSSLFNVPACNSQTPTFTSNIKPRTTHILPKNYLDVNRKRKYSSLIPEVPLKRINNRIIPSLSSGTLQSNVLMKDITLNVSNLESCDKGPDASVQKGKKPENPKDAKTFHTFLENLIGTPMKEYKIRKRKMEEDIDLK
ncbi:F-box only protein 28 [Euwallacea similis]|uniref:F-box only protein 28 n=1 Tax=Euwallacea similis TaxID=1736056 RepID=UPI00344FA86E